MYRLSLSGAVFVVGLVFWFRPVLGLLLFHHYRGPSQTITQQHIREQIVVGFAIGCIVVAAAVMTLLLML